MGLREKRISASDEYWHTKAELFSGAYSTRDLLLRPNQVFLRRRMEIVSRFITTSAIVNCCGRGRGMAHQTFDGRHRVAHSYTP